MVSSKPTPAQIKIRQRRTMKRCMLSFYLCLMLMIPVISVLLFHFAVDGMLERVDAALTARDDAKLMESLQSPHLKLSAVKPETKSTYLDTLTQMRDEKRVNGVHAWPPPHTKPYLPCYHTPIPLSAPLTPSGGLVGSVFGF